MIVLPCWDWGAATRIYVAIGNMDMRKQLDGLYGLVKEQLGCDPRNGHLYLFANKRRDRMKILYFDGMSLWVYSRRLEQGRLHWPSSAEGQVQLTEVEFALLVGGIDLRET
jgi:transposase